MNDHSAPTWANQLWHARELLRTKGPAALTNPHAMVGRTCGCNDCFCCAAAYVMAKEYKGYWNKPKGCGMSTPTRQDPNVPGDYAVFADHWIFWNGDGWRWVARNGAFSSGEAFRDAAECTLDYRRKMAAP